MAYIRADRVRDTSSTTGTGAVTVTGTAPSAYRTFSTVCSVSDTLPYFIQHRTANEWEVGIGTYTASNELTRTTVLSSSNAGAAVAFSAGTKDVVLGPNALSALLADSEDQVITGGAGVTSKSLGTMTSGTLTLDLGDRPMQHYTNGGAHTLAPGSVNGASLIDITNNGSAGAITTSGWTIKSGDAFTTTNGHKFRCHASLGNGGSLLVVQALQ